MDKKYLVFLSLLLISIFMITGCSSKGGSTGGVKEIFQVNLPDGSIKKIFSEDLKKLPLTSINVQGKVEEGPSLQEVLNFAGVKNYKQVVITSSSGSIDLTRKEVTPQTILDFTNKGTMKFASAEVPKSKWVKDIKEIKVD